MRTTRSQTDTNDKNQEEFPNHPLSIHDLLNPKKRPAFLEIAKVDLLI